MTIVGMPQARLQSRADADSGAHRGIRLALMGLGVVVPLLAWVLASAPTAIALTVIGVSMLQGLWRGGAALIGIVVGMGAAIPLALPGGRAVEGLIGSLLGTTGLTNRLASIGVVAATVTALGGAVGTLMKRRLLRERPGLNRWDGYVGAALGTVEGCVLALALLWLPLALEPVARAQMTESDAGGEPRAASFPAVGLAGAADAVRSSVLGRVAEATSPFGSSDLLALAADFAAISRDPDAMEFFMSLPVMQRIQELRSIETAKAILESDPQFKSMLDGSGVSADMIHQMMDSPTVLRVFDETDVVADFKPLENDLIEAIREARKRVRIGSNGR